MFEIPGTTPRTMFAHILKQELYEWQHMIEQNQ